MKQDDFASRILKAVGQDKQAIKKVSEALVSGDAPRIRQVLAEYGAEISEEEALSLIGSLGADREKAVDQAVAYWT